MKVGYALVCMLVGAAIGAGAMHTVHAQAKPPVYFVWNNAVLDRDGYVKEYMPQALATIKAHGGRILAAGKPTTLAGEPAKDSAGVQVWDSMEQLEGWLNSPEYRKAREIGEKYAKYQNFAVGGVPQQ